MGVVTRQEALSQSQAAGVDAVEIAPMAEPPVVKLIDYKNFNISYLKGAHGQIYPKKGRSQRNSPYSFYGRKRFFGQD